ncbi:ribose-phosphate diphosphokinase [Candidatus Pacearchaeota archaeon]|nr:ribose-phosphate diphosphokinase [Candidatus Pacearchaeota archaeon]
MPKEVLICGFSDTSVIAKRVAKLTGSLYSAIKCSPFPDGESLVRIVNNPKGRKVVIISSMFPNSNKKIIETLLAGSAARDYGAKEVILLATYMPYLRQDKSFNSYEAVSAREVVKLLTNAYDRVITIDPHLHRVNSLREYSGKAGEISSVPAIADYIKDKVRGSYVIVGPDEESSQWSRAVARKLRKEVHVLIKNRESSYNVKVSSGNFKLHDNVILIDDIISTGHTITEALKLLKKKGAKKITCIGIHGILAGDADKRIRKYAELITTNTIQSKYSKIDVSLIIADAVRNNQHR